MYRLNVWKHGWVRIRLNEYIFKNIWINIKNVFKNIKYSFQRISKGYCSYDLWDLDTYYLDLFELTLREFATTTHSYPDKYTFEEWQKVLHRIADTFHKSNEVAGYYKNIYADEFFDILNKVDSTETLKNGLKVFPKEFQDYALDIQKKYYKEETALYDQRKKDLQEAFNLIFEHFNDLWD